MPIMKKHSGHSGILQVFDKLVEEIGSPTDFELPECLNKWKPTPYSFIRRNVYLVKKVKRRQEDDGIFCSCSSTAGSSGVCGRDCLCGKNLSEKVKTHFSLWGLFGQWRSQITMPLILLAYTSYLKDQTPFLSTVHRIKECMLRSSCSSACNCGISCVNKPFHQRPVKKMKTVETEKCGLGVVAEEDINQGEFVIEYVGEVIDDKTCEERLWKMKHRGETNFYLCEINRDMVIDATYKGNKSRYINHSCCPNTEMQKWMIDGETRIGIFATCDIVKGEHLTYDYQFVQFGADQDCFCGAIGCRKKLGVKPNKLKMPSSDAALKIVARQMAANSPKVKAALSSLKKGITASNNSEKVRKHVHSNGIPAAGGLGRKSLSRRKPCNCIGSVIRITRSLDRSFGIIKRFDKATRRHLIMFEDGSSEFLDLSKEEWEFCNH